jgi:hypothetical protein
LGLLCGVRVGASKLEDSAFISDLGVGDAIVLIYYRDFLSKDWMGKDIKTRKDWINLSQILSDQKNRGNETYKYFLYLFIRRCPQT